MNLTAPAHPENNRHFIVSRSTNGFDFKVLGTVKSTSADMQINRYSFNDLLPPRGINYYRLTQADLDGTVKTFETKDLFFGVNTVQNILVYPNPTEDAINVSFDSDTYSSIKITNLQGQVLSQKSIARNQEKEVLSLKSLSPSIYFIKLSGKSNHTQKIIKK